MHQTMVYQSVQGGSFDQLSAASATLSALSVSKSSRRGIIATRLLFWCACCRTITRKLARDRRGAAIQEASNRAATLPLTYFDHDQCALFRPQMTIVCFHDNILTKLGVALGGLA